MTDLGTSLFSDDQAPVIKRDVYEGAVETVYADEGIFEAQLISIEGENPGFGFFEFTSVSDADRPLVEPGSLFWVVVERVLIRRHPAVRSSICFRRLTDPEPDDPDDWYGRARAAWLAGEGQP